MSFRCVNAFWFDGKIYPGGKEVGDSDPILQTHRECFVRVNDGHVPGASEVATSRPGESRHRSHVKEPVDEPVVEPEPVAEPKPVVEAEPVHKPAVPHRGRPRKKESEETGS